MVDGKRERRMKQRVGQYKKHVSLWNNLQNFIFLSLVPGENWQPILLDPREITCFIFHLPTHVGTRAHLSRVLTPGLKESEKKWKARVVWQKGRKDGRHKMKKDKAEENIYLLHVCPVLVGLSTQYLTSQSVERNEACYIRTGVFSKAFSVPRDGRMNFWTGTKEGNRRGDNQCQSQWKTQIIETSLTHPIRSLAWAEEKV